MSDIDVSKAVEISADTYWVGQREGSLLERNIFLRVFPMGSRTGVNMIVDPGPPADLMPMTKKVSQVVGNIRNVNLAFINHQDPDVAYNAGYLQKMNPNLSIVCSEDTWRLIRFYDLSPKKYFAVERFKSQTMGLTTGHQLRFVPTPFCHFRGATMIYDPETRILFTGDLFGGLSYVPDFYADERYWEGMKAFHQIYMPTTEAIALAIKSIRELDPPPLVIAPQHGSIIQGEWVNFFLDMLETLPVGLNLLADSQNKENYVAAMNEMLMELAEVTGVAPVAQAMKVFGSDGSISSVIQAEGTGIKDIKIDPRTALDIFIKQVNQHVGADADMAEMAIVKVLLGRNIPLPESMIRQGADSPEFLDLG